MSLIDRARTALGPRPGFEAIPSSPEPPTEMDPDAVAVRDAWVTMARRLSGPVLEHLAAGRLRATMPVEQVPTRHRTRSSPLEAVARVLAGIAPWIELPPDDSAESAIREHLRAQALAGLEQGLDPDGPDAFDFRHGSQPLVEAAFLGLALLRSPRLAADLDGAARSRLVAALESTRDIRPAYNNWLLFPATVEAALARLGAWWDPMRVELAVRTIDGWYVGDGMYADGPTFHWDHYASFVIHPMLRTVLDTLADEPGHWQQLREAAAQRMRRYAAIQERLVAPDGSFPPIGRSITYRCGAFHALAMSALLDDLPPELTPAQIRGALTAVMRRTLEAPGTFDADGWLRIGLAGHQPGLGEGYISTGSLYLAALVLLPLGLPSGHPFWADPPVPWTAQRAWAGEEVPIDEALRNDSAGR